MRILGYSFLTIGMLNVGFALLPAVNPDWETWKNYRMMAVGIMCSVAGIICLREFRVNQ